MASHYIVNGRNISNSELLSIIQDSVEISSGNEHTYDGHYHSSKLSGGKNGFIPVRYPNEDYDRLMFKSEVDLHFIDGLLDRLSYIEIGRQKYKIEEAESQFTEESRVEHIYKEIELLIQQFMDYEDFLEKLRSIALGLGKAEEVQKLQDRLERMEKIFNQYAWSEKEKVGFFKMYLQGCLDSIKDAKSTEGIHLLYGTQMRA